MPRYYCDYCDTFLTHDSPVVRKQHNTGYKHKANVRNYYMQFEEAQTQDFIDTKILEHLGKLGPGRMGMFGPGGMIPGQPGMPFPAMGMPFPGMQGHPVNPAFIHGMPPPGQPQMPPAFLNARPSFPQEP